MFILYYFRAMLLVFALDILMNLSNEDFFELIYVHFFGKIVGLMPVDMDSYMI